MNQEKQRIAIATACGWELSPDGKKWRTPYRSSYRFRRKIGDQFYYTNEVPDYLNSLDAMHGAEERLGALEPGARRRHAELLQDWLGANGAIFATAAQRAEAFLKTLGLWEEQCPA